MRAAFKKVAKPEVATRGPAVPITATLLARLAERGDALRPHLIQLHALLDDYGPQELASAVEIALAREALGAGSISHIPETRRRHRGRPPPVPAGLVYQQIRYEVANGVPGHIVDQVCQSPADPEQWLITSEWDSMASFEAWEKSPDHRTLAAPMRACMSEARSIRFDIRMETSHAAAGGAR